MKSAAHLALWLATGIFASADADAEAAQKKKRRPSQSLTRSGGPQRAVGIVEVFLFKNKNVAQRCAATHVGNGIVVTAGHCFLGAYDCNQAVVHWDDESVVSRCQHIIYSNASEAHAKGQEISNDLTVFKVDRHPDASVNLASAAKLQELQHAGADAIAISKTTLNGNPATMTSATCRIVFGPILNIFSQPKPSDTARHNCDLSEISSGSPLINSATNQLIALHQGTSLLPDLETSPNGASTHKIHFAKVISDIDVQKALNLPDALPNEIRVGGFAGEVFNTGIAEPIQMTLARIQARVGQTTVSFGVHNGLDSVVEAIDGNGKKMIFAGPRRAGYDQRFRMKAPVQIKLINAQGGIAPVAWIEDIQSP